MKFASFFKPSIASKNYAIHGIIRLFRVTTTQCHVWRKKIGKLSACNHFHNISLTLQLHFLRCIGEGLHADAV